MPDILTRDITGGAAKFGASVGKKAASLFGAGSKKQAEYAAKGAEIASKFAGKAIPKIKAKASEYAPQIKAKAKELGVKALKKVFKMKKGGKVKRRYRRCATGGKVRHVFHYR